MIPKVEFPSIKDYNILNIDEPIESLSKHGFEISPQYYIQGVPGSYLDCYARVGVIDKLKEAKKNLPKNLDFLIFDGYRPICVQQRLWDCYRQNIKIKYPNLTDEELDFKTSFFVSMPSYDICKPSLHNTGGAIDLTLIDNNGKRLNMGTDFDDFTNKSWTNYFEECEDNKDVRDNRRILYEAMISVGFTNLPSEWWHYDYGTKFWAYFNNTDALYSGILDINFPNRFPLH